MTTSSYNVMHLNDSNSCNMQSTYAYSYYIVTCSFSYHCRFMNMESRFAHLRQWDTSVSMLRVKMSRRRSQTQKENRERAVNTRRQLDKVPELEISSLDASIAMSNMSTIQEKKLNNTKLAKSKASFPVTATIQTNKRPFVWKQPSVIIRYYVFLCPS